LFLFISNASKAGETNMLDIKDSIIAASTKIPFFKNKKEGYIRYEVSFPNETGLMAQFYPKEMMFYFNENEKHKKNT
jgi:hypothetical protein